MSWEVRSVESRTSKNAQAPGPQKQLSVRVQVILKLFRLRFGETKLQPLKRKSQVQRFFELDAVTTAIHGVPRKAQ